MDNKKKTLLIGEALNVNIKDNIEGHSLSEVMSMAGALPFINPNAEWGNIPFPIDATRRGEGRRLDRGIHIASGDIPIRNEYPKINRNDKCPCGSSKKFKHCCEDKYVLYEGDGSRSPRYWSKVVGFADLAIATIFTEKDTHLYALPIKDRKNEKFVPLWFAKK